MRVRKEMNSTSSQDEFAKWAKLRRQHDKLLEQLDKSSTSPCLFFLLPNLYPSNPTSFISGYVFLTKNRYRSIFRRRKIRLRNDGLESPLGVHQRFSHVHPVLLHEAAHVLGAERVGALLRRVAAEFPARPSGERQRECVGAGVHCCDHARTRSSGCGSRTGWEIGVYPEKGGTD